MTVKIPHTVLSMDVDTTELERGLSRVGDAFRKMGVTMEEACKGLTLFGKTLSEAQRIALLNLEKLSMNLDDYRRLSFLSPGEAFRLDDCCYLILTRITLPKPKGTLYICQRADDRVECEFSGDQEVMGCPLEFYDKIIEGEPYHEVFRRRDDGSFAGLPERVLEKPKRKLRRKIRRLKTLPSGDVSK